jgi:hypothetical protein
MKTVDEIKREEQATAAALASAKKLGTQREINKLLKEAEELKFARLYLETTPSEESVQKQLDELQRRMTIEEERFGAWCAQKVGGRDELYKQYATACGLPVQAAGNFNTLE